MDPKPAADFAKDTIKPSVTAVLDALLAPKIARIRQWSAERDLEGRVKAVRHDPGAFFDQYLQRLHDRLSGVTTIVFPQRVLSLVEIYEPIGLKTQGFKEKPIADSTMKAEGARTYIIDGAGMGKSTYVKHLVLTEITEGDLVPIFLELRKVSRGETLIEAIGREIDNLGRKFDREILDRLLSVGQFLIVLDGYDEVPTADRLELLQDIESLAEHSKRSSVILTSRPATDLPVLPGSQVLTLTPLTDKQAQSLVRRLDKVGGIDVGERLIKEFDKAPSRFRETPLLVALLYRTYGFNNAISDRISSFYDEIYSAFYKGHDLTKSGFAREKNSGLGFESFRTLLRGLCFLMVSQQIDSFKSISAIVELTMIAKRLTATRIENCASFVDDLLVAVPLLIRDGTEFRFIHKTIGEFFAAEYLAFSGQGEALIQQIKENSLVRRFYESFRFLKEINESLFRKTILLDIARNAIVHQPDRNELLRTITFMSDMKIAVVKDGADATSLNAGEKIIYPKPGVGSAFGEYIRFNERNVYKGEVGGVNYGIWVSIGDVDEVFGLTLDELFDSQQPPLPIDGQIPSAELDCLLAVIPQNKWLSLNDTVFDNLDCKVLLEALAYTLSVGIALQSSGYLGINLRIYVISDSKMNDVISSFEEEAVAQQWLTRLINANPTSS